MVLKARRYENGNRGREVRKFVHPTKIQLNFLANTVFDVLKWDELPEEYISAPPLLSKYSNRELRKISVEDLPKIKSHSQDNERQIKETTRAAAMRIGVMNQKKCILTTQTSREKRPTEMNKSDFFS